MFAAKYSRNIIKLSFFNRRIENPFQTYLCKRHYTKMSRPKVLVTRPDIPQSAMQLLLHDCDIVTWHEARPIPRSELLLSIPGTSGIFCFLTDKIDEDVLLAAGKNLKVVATMSVGVDHLDLKALKKMNIKVGYTPKILTDATAELAIALLLATSRRLLEANKSIHKLVLSVVNCNDGSVSMYSRNEWKSWAPTWMCGSTLSGSTVGIVGLGRIGSRVGECLKGFNVKKILYTSRSPKEDASKFSGQHVQLDQLLEESDFIIVTIASAIETRNMFNAQTFKKMKKSAIFINVSRGDVVDQDALIHALKNGTIRAAGLDVMTPEPIKSDHELLKLENCVILPHIGSATTDTREKMAIMTVQNILAVLNNRPEEMPGPLTL